MNTKRQTTAAFLLMAIYTLSIKPPTLHGQATDANRTGSPVLLNRDQAAAILPPSVFFHGQSASIQGRNSAGLRMADGKVVLAVIVDTSGYSSSIQQTYQAYLLAEVPLSIGGKVLQPGAYGFGFVTGNSMVVMDIGSNEILRVATTRDDSLGRPNPLQILPDKATGQFRLYLGRSYVSLASAAKPLSLISGTIH